MTSGPDEVPSLPAAGAGRPSRHRSTRRWFVLGACVAGIVALLFATVGDGVATPDDATGWRRALIEYGHTLTWVLLALSLALAAARDRWTSVSQALAVAGAVSYVAFLGATFVL